MIRSSAVVLNSALRSALRLSSTQSSVSESLTPQGNEPNRTVVRPLEHPDYFGLAGLVTVKDLFNARAHLGHKEGTLHPSMRQYILGSRLGHTIIDLDITASLFRRALQAMAHIVYRGGLVLFLSPVGHPITSRAVEQLAEDVKEFAHCRPWKRGTFTNAEKQFGTVTRLPDLCVFLATPHDAIVDSAKMCIPTIAILDSNVDPSYVTYHVPGNDDSPSATQLYCQVFAEVVKRAKQKRAEDLPDFDGLPTVVKPQN